MTGINGNNHIPHRLSGCRGYPGFGRSALVIEIHHQTVAVWGSWRQGEQIGLSGPLEIYDHRKVPFSGGWLKRTLLTKGLLFSTFSSLTPLVLFFRSTTSLSGLLSVK